MLRRIDHVLSFLIFPEASFQFGNAVTAGRENKSKGISIARRVVIHKPQRSAWRSVELGCEHTVFPWDGNQKYKSVLGLMFHNALYHNSTRQTLNPSPKDHYKKNPTSSYSLVILTKMRYLCLCLSIVLLLFLPSSMEANAPSTPRNSRGSALSMTCTAELSSRKTSRRVSCRAQGWPGGFQL